MSNVPPGPSLRGAVDLSGLVRRHVAPPPDPAAGDGEGASKLSFPAGDADFQHVLQLSARVPVIVEFVAAGIEPALGPIVESYAGRFVHAVVDAQLNPQVAQAFQVVQVPAVAAVIGGRPVQLFLGIPAEDDVRRVFDDLLQVAAQSGVTGAVPVDGAEGAEGDAAPAEPPLPPRHQEAFDAISRGDFDAAIAAYRKALAENPRDEMAAGGLAQVSLLARLKDADAQAIRAAAAERPGDVEAQLAVADLDVSGGHLDDAFGRLLDLFPSLDAKGRETVRTRLLDYFAIAGPDDPRVAEARRRLAMLLY